MKRFCSVFVAIAACMITTQTTDAGCHHRRAMAFPVAVPMPVFAPAPVFTAPAPVVVQAPPVIVQAPPVVIQQPQVIQAPPVVVDVEMGHIGPTYAPAPTYQEYAAPAPAPAPVYSAPAPVYSAPAPAYNPPPYAAQPVSPPKVVSDVVIGRGTPVEPVSHSTEQPLYESAPSAHMHSHSHDHGSGHVCPICGH